MISIIYGGFVSYNSHRSTNLVDINKKVYEKEEGGRRLHMHITNKHLHTDTDAHKSRATMVLDCQG